MVAAPSAFAGATTPPPRDATSATTDGGAASGWREKNRARSLATPGASQDSILHARTETASATWVRTARGGASSAPVAPMATRALKVHASARSASRMPIQSDSASTAWDFCVRSVLETDLRRST